MDDPKRDLLSMFQAAVAATHGRELTSRALRLRPLSHPTKPCLLLATGKAAQAMAEGAQAVLGERLAGGLLISKPGHLDPDWCQRMGLESIEAGHPLPDANSLAAGQRVKALLKEHPDIQVLLLLSGGTSSLLELPIGGLGVAELRRASHWLLASGLDIRRINLARKALSHVKAGGLLRWVSPERLRVLAISDVPDNDPMVIGSGPAVPDPDLAHEIARLPLPAWLRVWADQGMKERGAPPRRGAGVEILADVAMARQAAAERAAALGYAVIQHPDLIAGDARAQGEAMARALLEGPAGVQLWGGETTMELPEQPGRGGRNQHLALAAAQHLAGRDDCFLLAMDTDGSDGPGQDAGALVDGGSLGRAVGLSVPQALRHADAGGFLAASGDLIRTGPTGTNVMDLVIGLKLRGG